MEILSGTGKPVRKTWVNNLYTINIDVSYGQYNGKVGHPGYDYLVYPAQPITQYLTSPELLHKLFQC